MYAEWAIGFVVYFAALVVVIAWDPSHLNPNRRR